MANEYATVDEVKDILHSNQGQGKIKIALGSSTVQDENSLNEKEVLRWINRAMQRLHSKLRRVICITDTLPIVPLSSVPDELKLSTQFLTAVYIRTKVLGGHRMQDEIDSAVSEWKEIVKELINDLFDNLQHGSYKDIFCPDLIISSMPQWNAPEALFTPKTGITGITPGRIADVDNQVVGVQNSDIWDDIFAIEV